MQEEVRDIIVTSLQKARDHDRTGNVGKAYAYYTVVAELCPSLRSEIEEAFVDVLCQWGIQLARDKRFTDVALCYERSLDIYPKNPRMLNNFAAHLLRNLDPVRAIKYLKRALHIEPTFLPAERNLQNAFSMAVDRWHFPMLNDKRRNNAFEQAIRKRISQGYDTVLDVGTGTGLLSLYAKDAGAKEIYACECSPVMVEIAKKVFETNNAPEIKLLPKFSYDLKIPDDIPERVKLMVTETFDAGLFGELVIPSMINVHKNILDVSGTVIPMSATLYTAAVECEYIRYRSSVVFNKVKEFCPLNFDNICVLPDDEFYDTENLENVQINYVTEPQILLTVNFNDLTELQEFSQDGVKSTVSAKCRYDGIVDGLVTWFKLHLDEEIIIDSSEGKSCWQLAVFPAIPKICKQGDILQIKAEMSKSKLKCSYVPNKAEYNGYNEYKFLYRLPKEIIAFLNDFEYVELLTQIIKSQSKKNIKSILDTSPFPIYGLMLLRENRHTEFMYYKTENLILRFFIERIAECNGLKEKVRIISSYKEITYSLDSIFFHNFDMKGELKDCAQEDNHEFFRCLLNPCGILMPEQIFLMGQLVFSEELPNMVYVKDANLKRLTRLISSTSSSQKNSIDEGLEDNFHNTTNYRIAQYINEFKIDQVFDLNSSSYLYEPLSDIHLLIEMEKSEVSENVVNFGKIKLARNKPLPNALICWYRVRLIQDQTYDTKRNGSFMNHTAILLEDDLRNVILEDKEVHVKVQQTGGLVKIKVL